jgi:hypothetical protein
MTFRTGRAKGASGGTSGLYGMRVRKLPVPGVLSQEVDNEKRRLAAPLLSSGIGVFPNCTRVHISLVCDMPQHRY